MNRREFLKRLGFMMAWSLIPIGLTDNRLAGWATLSEDDNPKKKRLIVIFLRGAVDGLNVVVPHGDRQYYDYRQTIAIPQPGQSGGALNLDGHFGLHPVLAPLMPLWQERSLAFVHAAGSPDPTRSHFDAQDFMETGRPGVRVASDGWMNRLLATLPGLHSPTQAVSFGETIPRIMTGRLPVANMPLGRAAKRAKPIDRSDLEKVFDQFYSGNDELSQAYREGLKSRKTLLSDLNGIESEMKAANNGAPSAIGFASDTEQLAKLLAKDPRIQLAFLAVGGWDTHVSQGSSEGQLANHLRPLGEGLATLAQGLGPSYDNTLIIVMSEFGRTAHENGNRGTDHGHGNVMWLLGGPVQGGKVYGEWPGLSPGELYEQRDLAVTTDFRSVLAQGLKAQFHLDATQLGQVFPDFSGARIPPIVRA